MFTCRESKWDNKKNINLYRDEKEHDLIMKMMS